MTKKQFTALLLTVLSLYTSTFSKVNTFCKEPENFKTVPGVTLSQNSFLKDYLFLSEGILWRVNKYTGTIKALNPNTLSPLWSSSGVVYRTATSPHSHSSSQGIDSLTPRLFNEDIEFKEIHGRVYFHLSELNVPAQFSNCSSSLPSSNEYEDQILAFDARTQGKLIWKLNANEIKNILKISSSAKPRFVTTPFEDKGNILVVALLLDSRTICLKVDARFGTLVLN